MPDRATVWRAALRRRWCDPDVSAHLLQSPLLEPLQPPYGGWPHAAGPPIGVNLVDRSLFRFDPWLAYQAGAVQSAVTVVLASVGAGKSALRKTGALRSRAWGRRVVVLDPKDEWGPFVAAARLCRHGAPPGHPCQACPDGESPGSGATVTHLRLGAGVSVNPLDIPADVTGLDVHAQRVETVATLVAASKGDVSPAERSGLDEAVRYTEQVRGVPTLPDVVDAALNPTTEAAAALHTSREALAAETRQAALALRGLVHGTLRGMFDRPTSPGVSLLDDVVVIDLSAVHRHSAEHVTMAAIGGFLTHGLISARARRRKTFLEVEEGWSLLRTPATALYFASLAKLSRNYGLSLCAVLHRLADLEAVGAAGSEQERLARGLLSEAGIVIVGPQPADQHDSVRRLLRLSEDEATFVQGLSQGTWLWRIGGVPVPVLHLRTPFECALTDTDQFMVDTAATPA